MRCLDPACRAMPICDALRVRTIATASETSMQKETVERRSPATKIDEQGFVSIGGIEQWITIRMSKSDNPVILFVHGGPEPLSPYASAVYGPGRRISRSFNGINAELEERRRNLLSADTELTIEQMARRR